MNTCLWRAEDIFLKSVLAVVLYSLRIGAEIAHTGRFGAKNAYWSGIMRHRCIMFRYVTVCTISGSQLTRFAFRCGMDYSSKDRH